MIETNITGLKRLTNTKNGNPRWEVSTPMGTWRTKEDAADAGKLTEYAVGRNCRLALENGVIRNIQTWNQFPDGTEGWH
jgi:hypothetical protein